MSAVFESPDVPPLHPPRAKNIALLLLAMTQFVIVIDASIVKTSRCRQSDER